MHNFREFEFSAEINAAIESAGFETPTPIQAQAIGPVLAGRDILAGAQTGSGKTAAFVLPIVQRLSAGEPNRVTGHTAPGAAGTTPTTGRSASHAAQPARSTAGATPQPGQRTDGAGQPARSTGKRRSRPVSAAPRALILAPTRELAAQIGTVVAQLKRGSALRHTIIYGGVGKQPQISSLRKGVDVLVATPGRLLDLLGEGKLTLQAVEMLVLDEADRMLDMGFLPDVRRILRQLPKRRQSLFFSATVPEEIAVLSKEMLVDPVRIEIPREPENTPDIEQSLQFVSKENKKEALTALLRRLNTKRALVFTRTKHGARRVAQYLGKQGFTSDSLHGDKGQGARTSTLAAFHQGHVNVLVATDIASRGLDVDDIGHVVNYDLPYEPEVYVHRIGRTARAGKQGAAVSFCDQTELKQLSAIERLTGTTVPVDTDHDLHAVEVAAAYAGARRNGRSGSRTENGGRNGSAGRAGAGAHGQSRSRNGSGSHSSAGGNSRSGGNHRRRRPRR